MQVKGGEGQCLAHNEPRQYLLVLNEVKPTLNIVPSW